MKRKEKEIIPTHTFFQVVLEAAPEGGYWAICPEVPGANGQGETIDETKNNLREAIELILEDHKAQQLIVQKT